MKNIYLFFVLFLFNPAISVSNSDSLFTNFFRNYSVPGNINNEIKNNNFFLNETGIIGEQINYQSGTLSRRLVEFNYLNRSLIDPFNSRIYEHLLPHSGFVKIETVNENNFNFTPIVNRTTKKYLPLTILSFSQLPYEGNEFKTLFNSSINDNSSFTFELNKTSFGSKSKENLFAGRFPNSFSDFWTSRAHYEYHDTSGFLLSIQNIFGESENGINNGIRFSTIEDSMYNDLDASVRSSSTYNISKVHHFDGFFEIPISTNFVYNLHFYKSIFNEQINTYDNILDSTFTPLDLRNKHESNNAGYLTSFVFKSNLNSISVFYKNEKHSVVENNFVHNQSADKSIFGFNGKLALTDLSITAEIEKEKYRTQEGFSGYTKLNWKLNDHNQFFVLFSSTLHFPNFQEIYWSDVLTFQPVKRDFDPIRIEQVSIGNNYIVNNSIINLSVHSQNIYNNIQPELSSVVNNNLFSQGFHNTTFQQEKPSKSNLFVRIYLSQAFSNFVFSTRIAHYFNENDSSSFPSNHLTFNLSYSNYFFKKSLFSTFNLSAEYYSNYFGKMLVYPSRTFVEQRLMKMGNQFIVNAFLRGYVNSVIFEIKGENLLDKKYMTIPLYPMMPRNLNFKISWLFDN